MASAIVISASSRKCEGFQSEKALTASISSTARRAYSSPPCILYVQESQNTLFRTSREV